MQVMVRCLMGAEYLPAFTDGMTNPANGMTVWESRDESPDSQQVLSYRGVVYKAGTLSVVAEILSDASWVDDILRRILEAQAKDEFNVSRVSLIPVEASYHIRNGFQDI